MEKLWLKNYPTDSRSVIEFDQYNSMLELFDYSVQSYADNVAYMSFEQSLTYKEIDKLSTQFAAFLQTQLGLKKDQRIALMCPNILPFTVAMWGIIKIGAVQVNVNPLYSAAELCHQLNDAQTDTIVIFSASTKTLADIIEDTTVDKIIVIYLDDLVNKGLPKVPIDSRLDQSISFIDALESGKKLTYEVPPLSQDDLLFLQYTGGTTGLSKGAMLTHGNLIANILQYKEFTKSYISVCEETIITAIPMYHIFALCVNTLAYFHLGGCNVLIANPRDMPSFVETWKKTKATVFTGVNTLFNGLMHTPGFSDIDFSSLKLSVGGGAPVQEAVAKKWYEVTGNALKEGYGLSETSPVLTLNLGTSKKYVSGIGIPFPSTDISIRDDKGEPVKQGETGELCASGPQVMKGYWNNPQSTRDSMTADGYFKTGDIALLDDDGFFHIVDRKKDMILVSGFNVYPNEIETVVAKLEGVMESACIGVKDNTTGEAGKLFVVRSDSALTEEQVEAFCRLHLTAYKVPKTIVFIEELPKSTVGKILRRKLKDF